MSSRAPGPVSVWLSGGPSLRLTLSHPTFDTQLSHTRAIDRFLSEDRKTKSIIRLPIYSLRAVA